MNVSVLLQFNRAKKKNPCFLLVERQWNKDGEWHGSEKEERKNEE